MADDQKPKTVTVMALQTHTYDGKTYEDGDTYEIDETLVDSVEAQRKAVRKDRTKRTTAVDPLKLEHKP